MKVFIDFYIPSCANISIPLVIMMFLYLIRYLFDKYGFLRVIFENVEILSFNCVKDYVDDSAHKIIVVVNF